MNMHKQQLQTQKRGKKEAHLPQPIPRGSLLERHTTIPTTLGAWSNLERLEKARRSWGRNGGGKGGKLGGREKKGRKWVEKSCIYRKENSYSAFALAIARRTTDF